MSLTGHHFFSLIIVGWQQLLDRNYYLFTVLTKLDNKLKFKKKTCFYVLFAKQLDLQSKKAEAPHRLAIANPFADQLSPHPNPWSEAVLVLVNAINISIDTVLEALTPTFHKQVAHSTLLNVESSIHSICSRMK